MAIDPFTVMHRWGPGYALAGPTPWTQAHTDPEVAAVEVDDGTLRVPAMILVASDERTEARVNAAARRIGAGESADGVARVFHVAERSEQLAALIEIIPGAAIHDVLRAPRAEQRGVLPVATCLLVARDAARAASTCRTPPRFSGDDVIIGWDGVARIQPRLAMTMGHGRSALTWLSPEDVRGLPVVEQSGVHVIGHVLYALLEGRVAWRHDSDFETLEAIRNSVPLPMARRDIPDVVRMLIAGALQAEPSARWPLAVFRDHLDEAVQALADPAQLAAMWRALLTELFPRQRQQELDWLELLQTADLSVREEPSR